MNDLISRQAAIEELERMVKEHEHDRFGGELIHWTGIKAVLDLLPSAQQELHWIPCSERLPAYGEKCLVTFKLNSHNDTHIGVSYCYVQKEGFWSDTPFEYKAIAWTPLPDPYQEGKQ